MLFGVTGFQFLFLKKTGLIMHAVPMLMSKYGEAGRLFAM